MIKRMRVMNWVTGMLIKYGLEGVAVNGIILLLSLVADLPLIEG